MDYKASTFIKIRSLGCEWLMKVIIARTVKRKRMVGVSNTGYYKVTIIAVNIVNGHIGSTPATLIS